MSSTIDLVPNVQELVKSPTVSVPQQYIRDNNEHDTLKTQKSNDQFAPQRVPAIDLELLLSNKTTDLELQKLHSTCKEWGIFQLVNHGVSSSLIEKLKKEVEEFYKLPLEEKRRYEIRPGEVEGYGGVARGEKHDWSDRLFMITNPTHRRNPHVLPLLPPSLRDTLEIYLMEMQKLAMKLLHFITRAVKIEQKEMEEMFDDGMQYTRITYYPSCPEPELVLGYHPHSDVTGITILNQLNGVDGLQAFKDGVWVPVNVIPSALLVNVGDIIEIMSNGIYKSVLHKVTVNSNSERISIGFFVNPKFEAEIGPASSLVNPSNPPVFRKIGMEQYLKDYHAHKINDKSYLDFLKINIMEE